MGPERYFVSNYWKTYAYHYDDIERIEEKNYGLFKLITIHLRAKGKLGRRITFIPSYKNYEHFISEHPDLFAHLT